MGGTAGRKRMGRGGCGTASKETKFDCRGRIVARRKDGEKNEGRMLGGTGMFGSGREKGPTNLGKDDGCRRDTLQRMGRDEPGGWDIARSWSVGLDVPDPDALL